MGLSQGSHRERPISASISRHTNWRQSLSESWSADCANSPANVGTLGRGGTVAARSHLRTPSRSLVLACVDSQCRRGEPRDNSASGQTMLTLKLIVAAARCDIASIRLSRTHRPSLRSPMGMGHLSSIWLGAGYRNRRRNDPRHRPNGHNPSTPGLRVRPMLFGRIHFANVTHS
jgi:hypothetical protein